MNQFEYLFLDLHTLDKSSHKNNDGYFNYNEHYYQVLIEQFSKFKQVHIHCALLDETLLNKLVSIGVELNIKMFMYCFTKEQYLYCIEHNITPHICWNNSMMHKKTWIDEFIQQYNQNNPDNESCISEQYEFFWMLSTHYIKNIMIEEYNNNTKALSQALTTKLKKQNIPVCFNLSTVFHPENKDYSIIHEFIKNIHKGFLNPLYDTEKNSIYSLEGNQYIYTDLNNVFVEKKMLLGFYGDLIVYGDNDIALQNTKHMNKAKICFKCELFDNCYQNNIGYFMYQYQLNECFGPKLMKSGLKL